jgi:hypothetical protein
MSKAKGIVTYKAEDLEKQSIALIEAHGLVFIDDVCAYLPCSRTTFYDKGLDKSDDIKNALHKVKTAKKVALRSRWEEGDNATLQMGLYKLLATPEELSALSMQQIDHRTKGESINPNRIFFTDTDGSERDQYGNKREVPPAVGE